MDHRTWNIIIGIIAVVALSLAVVCLLKKEKFTVKNVLVENDGNIGIQTADLVTQSDLDALRKDVVKWNDTIYLLSNGSTNNPLAACGNQTDPNCHGDSWTVSAGRQGGQGNWAWTITNVQP